MCGVPRTGVGSNVYLGAGSFGCFIPVFLSIIYAFNANCDEAVTVGS